MAEFSSSLKENEIQVLESPFKEDSKNVMFFQDGLKIKGKCVTFKQGHLLLCKLGNGQF